MDECDAKYYVPSMNRHNDLVFCPYEPEARPYTIFIAFIPKMVLRVCFLSLRLEL